MKRILNNNKSWITGVLTAMAASLCCIAPLLALLGAGGGLAASFSWLEPFRPYLIGVTILMFAVAWFQQLKPQKRDDCNCVANNQNSFRRSKVFLGIVTAVAALFLSFPFYSNAFFQKPQEPKMVTAGNTDIRQVVFKIDGMGCEGCIRHVDNEISKLNGIIAVQTSYRDASSTVKFDSNTCADSIAAAINKTGYKVILQTIVAGQ